MAAEDLARRLERQAVSNKVGGREREEIGHGHNV